MSKLKDIVRRTPLSSTELPNLQEFDRQLAIQAALGRLEKPCTVYNGPLSSKLFYDESEAIPNWHRACPMQKPAPVAQDGYTQHVTRQAKREQSDFIIYAIHDLNLPWNAVQKLFADWWGVHETVYSLQQQYCRLGRNIPFWNEDGYVFSMNNSLKGKKIDHSRDTSPRFSHKLGLAEQAPERAVRYIWVDMGVKRKAQVRVKERAKQDYHRSEKKRTQAMKKHVALMVASYPRKLTKNNDNSPTLIPQIASERRKRASQRTQPV